VSIKIQEHTFQRTGEFNPSNRSIKEILFVTEAVQAVQGASETAMVFSLVPWQF